MNTLGEILISEPVLEDQKLTSKITVSKDLTNFVKQKQLNIEYQVDIHADKSILNIPITASILPLAWLTGSNIRVGRLDRSFWESMNQLKHVFKEMFPLAPFTTKILAEELVNNQVKVLEGESGTGLFFSGGVDSMYSLINNIQQKPRLVMIWGIDNFPFPEHSKHWKKTISIYKDFAEKKKLVFDLIKTNVSQILDYRRIEHSYHKELFDGSFREALQHSLLFIPLVAPLSIGRFNRVIVAASFTPAFDFSLWPRAAVPKIDEKIIWADLETIHDGYISRKEKIERISEYHKNDDLVLRVCLRSDVVDGKINDSTCEKCLRTIASLLLVGIDPNECGFSVDKTLFKKIRFYWENKKTARYGSWFEIQSLIPEKIDIDIHGSRDFFEWFRDFNFSTTEKNWFFTDLYTGVPFRIAQLLDKVYYKLDINVHEGPYNRNARARSR